jgi:hypothetical protein
LNFQKKNIFRFVSIEKQFITMMKRKLKTGPKSRAALPISSLTINSPYFSTNNKNINNEIDNNNNNYEEEDEKYYFFEENEAINNENNDNNEESNGFDEIDEEKKELDSEEDDDITLYEEETFVKDEHAFTEVHSEELMEIFVNRAIKYSKNTNAKVNIDDELRFENNSESKCTVSEFARKFNNISATHGFSKVAMFDILNLFDQCTCNKNLPQKKKKKKKNFSSFIINEEEEEEDCQESHQQDIVNGRIDDDIEEIEAQKNLDLDKFIPEDLSKFDFDVCPKGCVVYIGIHSEHISCPICKSQRYSKCKNRSCQSKEYSQCNPFAGGHCVNSRFPLKTIFYRSSIVLLVEKLLTAHANNLDYLDYLERRLQHPINEFVPPDFLFDTVDSDPVRKSYKEMEDRYNTEILPIIVSTNNKKKIVMKNFILSGFFDGDTFFERKSDSGWMYLIGILNCNPSDRMSLGIGLYLALLHLEKSGGDVERFFMRNVFAEELSRLEKGIIIQ